MQDLVNISTLDNSFLNFNRSNSMASESSNNQVFTVKSDDGKINSNNNKTNTEDDLDDQN